MYIKNKSPNRTSFAHFHAYGRSQKYKIPSTIFILFFYLKKKIEVEKKLRKRGPEVGMQATICNTATHCITFSVSTRFVVVLEKLFLLYEPM